METIIEKSSSDEAGSGRTSDETLANSGFYWRERGGVKILICKPLERAGFVNGFSTRLGGVSAFPAGDLNLAGFGEDSSENILENRRRFLSALGSDLALATVWQVHGDTVSVVRSLDDLDSERRADAVISRLTGLLAGVKTADCVPVLIGDAKNGAYAAVHAGWRGTVKSIAAKSIAEMTRAFESVPSDLVCAIGPAACGRIYEVGRDVIDAFLDTFADAADYFDESRAGHAFIDLQLANRRQLAAAGVPDENIFTAPLCTMTSTNLFFSYRIEKERFGKTGRLMSVIGRA